MPNTAKKHLIVTFYVRLFNALKLLMQRKKNIQRDYRRFFTQMTAFLALLKIEY